MAQYQELFNEQRERMEQRDRLLTEAFCLLERFVGAQKLCAQQRQSQIDKRRSKKNWSRLDSFGVLCSLINHFVEPSDDAEAEAAAAAEQLRISTREMEYSFSKLEQIRQKLADLTDCGAPEYGAGPTALQLAEIDQRSAQCVRQGRELAEVLYIMHRTLSCTDELQTTLAEACYQAVHAVDRYNFFDEQKRELLERALAQLEQLKPHLEELNRLPTGTELRIDLPENIRDTLRDWNRFFKNPNASVVATEQIELACTNARTLHRQLIELLDQMYVRVDAAAREWAKTMTDWQRLTEETPL